MHTDLSLSAPLPSATLSKAVVRAASALKIKQATLAEVLGISAIVGPGEKAYSWLNHENLALKARPVDLIRSAQGLVNVVEYLDYYRGRI